jgi:chromosome partitioning protein
VPIITVSNQKGGVGKTTSTLNLGAALQELGKRVLMVDLDPQGSLSVACGLPDVDPVGVSIGDLVIAYTEDVSVDLQQAVVHTPCGLDVIPGNGMLGAAELALGSATARESALATTLAPALEVYDYILVDCLPSLGLMSINALRAATGVVVPVGAEFLAVHGLGQILETIYAVKHQLNSELEVYGVLLTMVDARRSHAQRVVETVRHSLKGQVHVFDTEIGYDPVFKDAAEEGKSVFDVSGGGRAADMFRKLACEVMEAAGEQSVADRDPHWRGVVSRFLRGLTRAA